MLLKNSLRQRTFLLTKKIIIRQTLDFVVNLCPANSTEPWKQIYIHTIKQPPDFGVSLVVEVVESVDQYQLLVAVGRLAVVHRLQVQLSQFLPRLVVHHEVLEVVAKFPDGVASVAFTLPQRHLAFARSCQLDLIILANIISAVLVFKISEK